MSLEDIVEVTITAATASPTRPGFGTPLIAASKLPADWGVNRVRSFQKLAELVDAGVATTDPVYLLASKIKSQSPCPKTFKVGKRALAPSQSLTLVCTSATEGDIYSLSIGVEGASATEVTYTVPNSATTTTVATALELLIEAVTGVSSSSSTATITVTPATAGDLVRVQSWSSNLTLTDATSDPGIATDLDAIYAEDSDWYGLLLDSNSKAEVVAAAAWVETNKRIFVANSSDSACFNSGSTTDVAYVLKAAAYDRTAVLFDADDTMGGSAAAWMGKTFPYDPGSLTWSFKTLAGVSADALTTAKTSALANKKCNFYTTVAGLNVTQWGTVASGEFLDITHGIDWLESEMKIQVFAALVNNPKLPYTKNGINVIVGIMKGVLRAGVRAGLLADDEFLTVTAPELADIDATTRGTRLLPDMEFGGTLAGAIHSTQLSGTLSV